MSLQRRTPEVWWPASGFRLCIFRERYRQSRRRSVRSLRGWERELFSNQIHVKSNKWSSQSVLYNAVLTHRLFPFGITGVAFGSHVRRTLPEGLVIRRTSVWRTLPAGLVVRRTSFGRTLPAGFVIRPRQPVSRLPVISSRSIPSFEISSFHAYATAVADDRFLSVSVVVGEQALQRWPCFHLRWCRRCRPAEFLELVI